jgi:hypothetical protein
MFRAVHRSSSGALTVFAASGLHTHVVNGRSPHAYVNHRLQIQLELLMMGGVPLETCWAFNEWWNNKFCYKVASCWLFLLDCLFIYLVRLFYLHESLHTWEQVHFGTHNYALACAVIRILVQAHYCYFCTITILVLFFSYYLFVLYVRMYCYKNWTFSTQISLLWMIQSTYSL